MELVDYGVLETKNERLLKLEEKPQKAYEVSMGIYMMSKNALDFIPYDEEFGFDHLMYKLIENNKGKNTKIEKNNNINFRIFLIVTNLLQE